MKEKGASLIIFVCSALALIISLILFRNMGAYVDEYGTSPQVVYGGHVWSNMAWLRLALLAVTTLVSGVNLFRKWTVK